MYSKLKLEQLFLNINRLTCKFHKTDAYLTLGYGKPVRNDNFFFLLIAFWLLLFANCFLLFVNCFLLIAHFICYFLSILQVCLSKINISIITYALQRFYAKMNWAISKKQLTKTNSLFSSSRDTTVQNLDFTRQTTDITHFAVVFHYDVISI